MQTFLPYPDFSESLSILDYRRLGKQRVEAMQIVNVLTGKRNGWANHPAVIMWRGSIEALKLYHNIAILQWIDRGYNNTMQLYEINYDILSMPEWLGDPRIHASHRGNLLRKDPEYYGQFGWTEQPSNGYFWPR